MTDEEEEAYLRGERAIWRQVMTEAATHLWVEIGDKDPSVQIARLLSEREAAIAVLRSLCAEYGDNQWNPDLHLADIIDKHLGNYLGDDNAG